VNQARTLSKACFRQHTHLRQFIRAFSACEYISKKEIMVHVENFEKFSEYTTEILDQLKTNQVIERIWRKDFTVWSTSPTEITNRLGWLDVVKQMRAELPELLAFAEKVQEMGTTDVVVMGMGGSSLTPEVFRTAMSKRFGWPRLHVLDSTVPAWVLDVEQQIDLAHTVFLYASKSGSTVEVDAFFRYFHGKLTQMVGAEAAGKHFIAITDPCTALQAMAKEYGFLHTQLNDPNIGGRYSGLSYFGLLPAALAGLPVPEILASAYEMFLRCEWDIPSYNHSGAILAARIFACQQVGRDKISFITSPRLENFGLWAEQLIAESVGKEGVGVLPIATEPLVAPNKYSDDRIFVYLRLAHGRNSATDQIATQLRGLGHPIIRIELEDSTELGGELYRWMFITAILGHLMNVQPFDQPNVQSAKLLTKQILQQVQTSGKQPEIASVGDLRAQLRNARHGDYVAILAFIEGGGRIENALVALRHNLTDRFGLPTTAGFGPRYLHSTGQLHKGGPDNGIYVLLVNEPEQDIPVPGKPYSFRTLAHAQALGDYQALQQAGRRVVRINLGEHQTASSIRKIIRTLA
jgi:glucose-6-phosphate isomerase/transaldolase/glucose-6-phosphate isomerase